MPQEIHHHYYVPVNPTTRAGFAEMMPVRSHSCAPKYHKTNNYGSHSRSPKRRSQHLNNARKQEYHYMASPLRNSTNPGIDFAIDARTGRSPGKRGRREPQSVYIQETGRSDFSTTSTSDGFSYRDTRGQLCYRIPINSKHRHQPVPAPDFYNMNATPRRAHSADPYWWSRPDLLPPAGVKKSLHAPVGSMSNAMFNTTNSGIGGSWIPTFNDRMHYKYAINSTNRLFPDASSPYIGSSPAAKLDHFSEHTLGNRRTCETLGLRDTR